MSGRSTLERRVAALEAGAMGSDDNAPIRWTGIEGFAGDPDFEARVTSAEAALEAGTRLMVVSKQRWPGDL